MLTNISWGTYATAVALLLTGWYAFVGFRFYFTDVKDILSGKRKFRTAGQRSLTLDEAPLPERETPSTNHEISTSAFAVEDPTFNDVDAVIEKLKSTIADAAQRRVQKEELLAYLQLILQEFPTVKNSPFRESVSEFIASQCNTTDTITMTPEEAERLWD